MEFIEMKLMLRLWCLRNYNLIRVEASVRYSFSAKDKQKNNRKAIKSNNAYTPFSRHQNDIIDKSMLTKKHSAE